MGDDHDDNEDEESLSRANEEKEDNDDDTIMLGKHVPAIESMTLTIKDKIQMMFLRLGLVRWWLRI